MIAAIPTNYEGVTFRSRLEARWAVFFDQLGIPFEYEPEAFRLNDGRGYLPDFWVRGDFGPGDGAFVEIKPEDGDASKAAALAEATDKLVVLCRGSPSADFSTMTWFLFCRFSRRGIAVETFQAAVAAARAHRFWDPPEVA